MRKLLLVFVGLFLMCCGKENPPSPPDPAALIFPTQNLDCAQGALVNELNRKIAFQWAAAKGAESYELQITQLSNGVRTKQTTLETSLEIPLKIGEAYSWKVVGSNTKVLESTSSALWYFFNAGAQTTHAPFPATALSPVSGSLLNMPSDGVVSLRWMGSDIDNDIVGYSLLLDTQDPPVVLQNLVSNTATQFSINVGQGQTYYWQIITKDSAGNETHSAIFDFKIKQ